MGVLSFLSINPQEGKNPPTPGGFFLPFGFPVGHVTLKAVLHASVNLYTVSSRSCGFVMLSGGSMGRIFITTSLYLE